MKVNLEGREIWIEFAYSWDNVPVNSFETEGREVTTCMLRDASVRQQSGDREPPPVLAQATVVRYYRDPPNREVARKAALTKVIADLDSRLCTISNMAPLCLLDKPRRKLFWDAYLNRKQHAMQTQVSHAGPGQ